MDLFECGAQMGRMQDICAAFSKIHAVPLMERSAVLPPFLEGLNSTSTGRRMELALYHDLWEIVDLQELINSLIDDYPGETLAYLLFDMATLIDGIQTYDLWTEDSRFARTAANCTLVVMDRLASNLELEKAYNRLVMPWCTAPAEFLKPRDGYLLPQFSMYGSEADTWRAFGGDVAEMIKQIFRQSLVRSVDILSNEAIYWGKQGNLELATCYTAAQKRADKLTQTYAIVS